MKKFNKLSVILFGVGIIILIYYCFDYWIFIPGLFLIEYYRKLGSCFFVNGYDVLSLFFPRIVTLISQFIDNSPYDSFLNEFFFHCRNSDPSRSLVLGLILVLMWCVKIRYERRIGCSSVRYSRLILVVMIVLGGLYLVFMPYNFIGFKRLFE